MKLFSDEIRSLMSEFEKTKKALREAELELQKKIGELENSNKQLEDSKKELTRNIDDLKRNETTMLNIMEDARELEKSLKKERDLINAVISSMGEGLIVVSKEQKVILVNQVASILLRKAPEEVLNKSIDDSFCLYRGNREDSEKYQFPLDKLVNEANIINFGLSDNFYSKDKDGKMFPVAVIMASLLQSSVTKSEVTGAVIIFRNISVEKNLDEAKSGFISIASHQLRTPLTSIRWFSEMLLDGDAGEISEDQKHFIERIYQGTDRMINLVNLLLQIARVEAGRIKIEPVPIDLKLLTEGVVMTLTTQLKEKKQEIKISAVPEELPKVPMDEDVAWQIIQNLLTNAIRYSREEKIISVVIELDKDKEEIIFSVKDEGIGIPKSEQGKIFEKFFRADNAFRYVPEGSGLGLNLAKKLVEDWNGRIWFESEEGKGTVFFFTVPISGMQAKKGEVKLKV